MGSGGDAGLRSLPSVHELAAAMTASHPLAVAAARQAIEEARGALRSGSGPAPDLLARAQLILAEAERPSLRRVINATGVILHTNLGRAPLARSAREALARVAEGYTNLELDLVSGERGSRHVHVESLLGELTGAPASLAVNNGAAAVLLAVSALAGPGRAVVVSRGQAVEIGGGFRIPEVIAQSGSALIEVGTTNRTRVADYQRALEAATVSGAEVGAILRVHPSNFRTVGFVEDVTIEALCRLNTPVIDDAGSGVLSPGHGLPALAGEPEIAHSLRAGAALVCCSGDKLLGGPQAGLLLGRPEAIAAARRHPLARALRIDKLSLAALEATLILSRDPARARTEIPVLAMLGAEEAELRERAQALRRGIGEEHCALVRTTGRAGGGSLPLLELEGPAVALLDPDPRAIAGLLREGEPPVVARIHDGRVLLDPRTVAEDDVHELITATRRALGRA
ncbi:MAG: L-seryl-tRNA(Sec) selenium transferase [Solirubrobacteraceae bacterium]